MKLIARNLVMLVVAAMSLTGLSLAQQFAWRVAANVPDAFYAGAKYCPAGNYLFTANYGDHAVTIKNQDTGRTSVVLGTPETFALTGSAYAERKTFVQLDWVGGQYVLADLQMRTNGVSFPEEIPNNVATDAMARDGKTVTVYASLR